MKSNTYSNASDDSDVHDQHQDEWQKESNDVRAPDLFERDMDSVSDMVSLNGLVLSSNRKKSLLQWSNNVL